MLDRTIAPPFVKSSSFDLITPEELTLSNGIHLYFVPGSSQDVVKIEFIFEAGRWFEKQRGAAWFTGQLLSKGTKDKTSYGIAQLFDLLGTHLEVSPGLDFVSVALYSLTKNLKPSLDLLIEILTTPVFPEKEFRLAQSVFIQNLRVNNEKTSFVASRLFRKNLFGANHPYGAEAEENAVNALDTGALQSHFTDFFHSARVFISGKIEPQGKQLMTDALAALPPGKTIHSPEHAISPTPGHEVVSKEDSVQSSVRMGKRSLLRSDPYYTPLVFASHILGGYFGSRLMKNIREEKGLTYGISASIQALRNDSFLVIGADVNKENTDLTFEEIRKELRTMRTTLVGEDELETTRNHFIGSLQSEITTSFAHAEKIKAIVLYGLAWDHYQKMITRVDSVTPQEIMDTCERFLHEESFYEVAVG